MAFSTFDILKKNDKHLEFIKEHGFDLDKDIDQRHPRTKRSILETAILNFEDDIVKTVVENKADVNPSKLKSSPNTIHQATPLQLAVSLSSPPPVKYLLEHKADISPLDRSDNNHLSILMRGALADRAISGDFEILKMLLEAKADIHQENISTSHLEDKHMTALMYAARMNNTRAAIFLLDQGANIKNSKGKSVFECSDFLTKKLLEEYITQQITITRGLQAVLNDLSIPKDLNNLICSYSRGFSFIEKEDTSILRRHKKDAKKTEPLDNPVPEVVTVKPKKEKVNVINNEPPDVGSSKAFSVASSPVSTSKIKKKVSVSANQSTFFKEKRKSTLHLNTGFTTTHTTKAVNSLSQRKRCDCLWLRHTLFNLVGYVYPSLVKTETHQVTNKKVHYSKR